jgi:hypothetical protein
MQHSRTYGTVHLYSYGCCSYMYCRAHSGAEASTAVHAPVYALKVGRNYIWMGRKCIYGSIHVREYGWARIRIYNHILQLYNYVLQNLQLPRYILQLYNSCSSTVRCVGTSLCNILRQCERRSQDPTEFLCCLTFQQDASLNWVSPPFWHLRNWEKVQFRVFIYPRWLNKVPSFGFST